MHTHTYFFFFCHDCPAVVDHQHARHAVVDVGWCSSGGPRQPRPQAALVGPRQVWASFSYTRAIREEGRREGKQKGIKMLLPPGWASEPQLNMIMLLNRDLWARGSRDACREAAEAPDACREAAETPSGPAWRARGRSEPPLAMSELYARRGQDLQGAIP